MTAPILVPHAGLRPTTEAEVARACDDLAERMSWKIERYEQGRETQICEGIPDRRYHNGVGGFRVWVELKSPTGKLTLEQHNWLIAEQAAGALALAVDDRQQLVHLWNLTKQLYGRNAALDYCREVTALIAKRGYRRPKKRRGRPRR